VTSGASCPDVLMNGVVQTIAGYFDYGATEIEAGLDQLSLYGEPVPV
jgi:4-hydroxy-3-methylbut-2-enyl diphosphate reductase IspH